MLVYPLQERLVWSCKAWHHRCITFRGPYRCWIAAQQGTRSSLSKSEINSGKPSMGSSTRPELHMTGLVGCYESHGQLEGAVRRTVAERKSADEEACRIIAVNGEGEMWGTTSLERCSAEAHCPRSPNSIPLSSSQVRRAPQ